MMIQFQLSATGFEKQNPKNFYLERATANLLIEMGGRRLHSL